MPDHRDATHGLLAEANGERVSFIERSAVLRDEAYVDDTVTGVLAAAGLPNEISLLLGKPGDMGMDLEYFVVSYDDGVVAGVYVAGVYVAGEDSQISLFDFARRGQEVSPAGVYSSFSRKGTWTHQNGIYKFEGDEPAMHALAREPLGLMKQFARENADEGH